MFHILKNIKNSIGKTLKTPQPGIEPGSRPRQGRVLTIILLRQYM